MNLEQQLELEEDRRSTVYRDSEGWLTIGVGRLVDSRRSGGLSDDEIDYLLANDIREKTAQVLASLPWAASLSEPRRAVLIGMAFQLGIGGLLAFHDALAAVQRGDYSRASDEMLDSLWARQTPERAARMAKQMRTGEWQVKETAKPPAARPVAPSAPAPVPVTQPFAPGPIYTGPNRRAP